jgi:hypothetical protein
MRWGGGGLLRSSDRSDIYGGTAMSWWGVSKWEACLRHAELHEGRQEAQAEWDIGGVHGGVAEPEWRRRPVAAVPGERVLVLVFAFMRSFWWPSPSGRARSMHTLDHAHHACMHSMIEPITGVHGPCGNYKL